MGMHAQDTAELFFNNVKVPKENVLGDPGRGFVYLMNGLAEERLISGAGGDRQRRAAFNLTRQFVMERKVFGKPPVQDAEHRIQNGGNGYRIETSCRCG